MARRRHLSKAPIREAVLDVRIETGNLLIRAGCGEPWSRWTGFRESTSSQRARCPFTSLANSSRKTPQRPVA